MTLTLTLDEQTQQYIDEQVKSGRFPSAEAAVQAAIADWCDVDFEVDDETIAALREGEAQADRGEGMDSDAVRKYFAERRPRQ